MYEIWRFIEAKAKEINSLTCHLAERFSGEDDPLRTVAKKILADDYDHLEALKYLFEEMTGFEHSTKVTELAQKAVKKHKSDEAVARYKEMGDLIK